MINLKFDCEKVMIDIDRAIPCGIIMNEVLGNAFEYGYGLMEKGEIRLSVFRDQQNIVMKIDNDGRTFDQTYDDLKKDHLGMKLIDTLARQIGGSVRYESVEDGVEFELRFPELNSGGSKKWT